MTRFRPIRAAAFAMALAMVLSMPGPATAATGFVTADDFFFDPTRVRIVLGDDVSWSNEGTFTHSVTSDGTYDGEVLGFSLDPLNPNGNVGRLFNGAGSYLYHCRYHTKMRGRVDVAMTSQPRSGPVGRRFSIRWAVSDFGGYVFDVQIQRPGEVGFKFLRRGTTEQVAMIRLNDAGEHRFRSRLRNPISDEATPWSPELRVIVREV